MKKILILITAFFLLHSHSTSAQNTLLEGFENWSNQGLTPPPGWQSFVVLPTGGIRSWRSDFNSLAHTGTGSAYSNIDNAGTENWLVSPAITITNNSYQLKYWELNKLIADYETNTNQIYVSSGSSNPASGNFVLLSPSNGLNDVDWAQRTLSLSAYSGQTIYIAFRHKNTAGKFHTWNIDDVSVSPSSFTDGGISAYVSPVGVSETPGSKPVTVTIKNFGTTVINNFTVNWTVKNVAQTPKNITALNLQPGATADIILGNYNFAAEGWYSMQTTLVLTGDFDSSNNIRNNIFEIASFKDATITKITPSDLIPTAGNKDIIITISNLGQNTINTLEIPWAVNGSNQIPYASNSLNLVPGETRDINLGAYNLPTGVYYITAQLDVLGDINSANDFYASQIAVGTFYESFEGPNFPSEGWDNNFGSKENTNFGSPYHGNHFYAGYADDNYFGKISDTLYTPVLTIKNGDRFKFYLKTSLSQPGKHSLVSKNPTTGVVTLIQNITNTPGFNNWELRDIDISTAVGNNRIGIVTATIGGYAQSEFDLITSTATLFLYDNDLKVENGDMHFLAKQNTSQKFTCKIKNAGKLAALGANYTVNLMEGTTVLATVNGVNIPSWEEASININHTFTSISQKRLHFKIVYAADQNSANNTFREANVSVVPNTVIISSAGGQDTKNLSTPFSPNGSTQTLGEDDISQCMYYPNEYNTAGNIYGIAYKYDNLLGSSKVKHYPLKVWIKQTAEPSFDNGWVPQQELTLVFDGTIEILPGLGRDLYIPFNQPVLLNGFDNIVIQCYQYDPEWPPSLFRIFSDNNTSGPIRTIGLLDYYGLDINNLPNTYYANQRAVYTRFVMDPTTNFSVLSGAVNNSTSSTPIENATVSVEGSSVSVQTDVNGNYTLPQLPYGQYNVKATKLGFTSSTLAINLNAPTQTQNYLIAPLPEIQVTGRVFGDNNIATPLQSVSINMKTNGTEFGNTTTNSNGDFVFPVVYGGSDYDVVISLYGYYTKTITITAIDTNIDLGNIVLEEEFISPFNVMVDATTNPTINWKSPKQSAKVKLKHDFGEESNNFTNEPNEEVWLGNYFLITEPTTLTSVEFKTGKYANAIDYVTVDIFDMSTYSVLASSKPFLIQADSTHVVDIPNIVVTNNIAAMIHWKDNAASTNTLAIDWSDENIFNGAVITFPKDNIYQFSDWISAPISMSFLMRVNTLVNGTPITNNESVTYNVYRGLDSDFPDISKFNKINQSPVTDITLVDDTGGINPIEYYRYAVETIYTNGLSEVTFSNSLLGSSLDVTDYQFLNSEISIFPNPAKEKITIKFGQNIQIRKSIEVIDILGKNVLTIKPSEIINGYVTKNVNSLNAGMYFMKADIDGVIVNKKFIVN